MTEEQIKRRDELATKQGQKWANDLQGTLIRSGFRSGYDAGFADAKSERVDIKYAEKRSLDNVKLRDEIAELTSKLEVAKKALQKYANKETHSMDKDGFVWSGDYFDYETAQAALKELE